MTLFNIDFISDTICPWCYIGYRRLQKAIQLFQKTYPGASSDEFKITWKPYYLVPDAPAVGLPMTGKIAAQ
jgi:predicted DsbA family dithiol-disulfide isomerase